MKCRSAFLASAVMSACLLPGCGDSNDVTFPPGNQNQGTPVVAPVAANDAFSSRANAQVSGNLLNNDSVNGAKVASNTSPGHGAVVVNGDGSFTYTPTTGFQGSDSFTYTLSNSAGSSTATVSLTLAGVAFFVNNQAAGGGDGSQAHPFQTLAAAVASATGVAGAQIVVFQGDGTSTGYNTSVTLTSGQSLVGFSAAAQPVLTGQVVFTTGNSLQNVRMLGMNGVAVNATGASNGTIQGVTVANDTSTAETVDLDNASGTFAISNCVLANLAGAGFASTSSSGNLVWTVSNCSFSNNTQASTGYVLTGTSAHNLTVTGCTFTGGPGKGIVADANTATAVGLVMTNNTINGQSSALLGLEVSTQGTTAFTGIISGNNVTGCAFQGMLLNVLAASSAKLDFKNNRTLSNAIEGVEVVNGGTATVGAIFNSNVSDSYVFTQAGGAFSIEQFAVFSLSSHNTGTVVPGGTITDAPAGSLGIP